MAYYIDLKSFSIDKYKEVLKTIELIPSWQIVGENIDENLDKIKDCGISNLDELLVALKDKNKTNEFARKSGLNEKYLSVLKRVLNGYKQKPNRIKDFAFLEESFIEKLEQLGIKNTLKLYDFVQTKQAREELGSKTGISEVGILKLTKLADLSRIRWVNHTFAYVLLEAGYDTTEKISKSNYQNLYEDIKQLNNERQIYDAHIGMRDMKMVIDFAKELDFDIEY